MQTETVISLVIAACALLFTIVTFARTLNKDTGASAAAMATLSADVRYIRSSVDDIKLENRATREDVNSLQQKVVELEASCKSAHKRLDDLMNKG